ncbi:SMI1/KNR4 family protein [Candidatus Nucleicultrix amoebiphila]|uniref:Cell wall assembly protein n=1 Tax=Candidatus Nucleicultrix amoebiphila FS5 TaxID=1414854 RepID=A0A1W6N374_9PROT|nr:SMI1/KNR4 family protein [Candidatus Nucleicultrix amoebiphila]ARN84226.1 cell wall assembly protein [Candidatus Nucleicultrix amoebiphila FS5]
MAFPTQENIILENEKEIGCKFPSSYRNKMMNENGGEIEFSDDHWQLFPFFDKTDKKTISRTCNSIFKETKLAREWRGFPDNAIAIATNGCGDFLVFIKENTHLKNEVYIWLHETTELKKVAVDFSEIF